MAENKQVRVWADGCFDMVHFGHANAIRQAKMLGDHLIVGVHSDEEITKHKGPPVFTEAERYKMVRAIKWVDEIVENAPYVTQVETLDNYDIDFCVHGDDCTTTADGADTYSHVKKAGRYRECRRTQGVSTTNLIERMLQATTSLPLNGPSEPEQTVAQAEGTNTLSPYTGSSPFLPTTLKIAQFSSLREAKSTDHVVYTAGTFDLFHVGHVDFLEKAAAQGDYLVVGLHSDSTVKQFKGREPIQNLDERVLSVLACKYVNEVVIGAPYEINDELLGHFKVDVVVHGFTSGPKTNVDPHQIPRSKKIFKQINSGNKLTTLNIVDRIKANRLKYVERNRSKQLKEVEGINAAEA